jgi:hypothetical protein
MTEHMFWPARRRRKLGRGTNASQLVLAWGLLLVVAGCLPDPQRVQMARLLDQLVGARSALAEQPPVALDATCGVVSEVGSRLAGEPGLVDVRPAWPALRAATDSLSAVCGRSVLLQQPFEPTAAMVQARKRWQEGIAADLDSACRRLKEAAVGLNKSPPTC